IEVGRIADAWGLKGWFKVLPHSADPEALFSSKRWYLQPTTQGKIAFSGTQLMRIREAKFHSDNVVAAAHDIEDRDIAQSLKGSRIFIPRSSFPTPELDSYYWVDLIGLDVVNRESVHLGVVKDLLSTGPQTVLVIEYTATDDAGQNTVQERMIPFVSHYVDDVNLQNKRITVDWQTDY
ncbi:MAG: ribosome maturation factor RimM, partial [Polaromonas sp.]|nr:ribosome maturation factor RimM [Polaromonas sp.]